MKGKVITFRKAQRPVRKYADAETKALSNRRKIEKAFAEYGHLSGRKSLARNKNPRLRK